MYCDLVTPYGNIDLDHGLLPDGNNALAEPILTSHQTWPMAYGISLKAISQEGLLLPHPLGSMKLNIENSLEQDSKKKYEQSGCYFALSM